MADGDTLRTIDDVLEYAAARGVTQIHTVVSLEGGYERDAEHPRHTAIAKTGGGSQVGVGKGHTSDDAIVAALAQLGVCW